MKKWTITIGILLCFCLFPLCGEAAAQRKQWKDGDCFQEQRVENISVVNRTLFFSYTDGEEDGSAVILNPMTNTTDVYQEYGLNMISCVEPRYFAKNGVMLFELVDGEAEPLFKESIGIFSTEVILSSAVVGDMLFLHVTGGQTGRLIRLSLIDGQYTTVSNCQPYGIAPGPDQTLYVMQRGSGQEAPVEIALYDAEGRWQSTMTKIDSADVAGFACDQESGDLYWMAGSTLYRWREGEAATLRIMPIDDTRMAEACFASGLYCVRTIDGTVCFFDPENSQAPVLLTIAESEKDTLYVADGNFMLANPGVNVQRMQKEHYCAEEAFEAIQNGDDTVDIFRVDMTASLRKLMEKNYLVPLSDEPALAAFTQRLYPAIQELLTVDGVLYGVPFYVRAKGWRIDAERDGQIEIPTTIDELLDALEDWESNELNYGQDYVRDWSAMDLASYAMEQYVMAHISCGEQVTFQDEQFRAVLLRIRGLMESGTLPLSAPADNTEAVLEGPKTGAPYYGVASVDGYKWPEKHIIASPAWHAGEAGMVYVDMSVYIINPWSQHRAEALNYLVYMMEHMHFQTRGYVDAMQEPALSEVYAQSISSAQKSAEVWRERLANATDEETKRLCTLNIEGYERQAQRYYDEPSHWAYYAPALEAYRANVAPNLFAQTTRLLEGSDQTHAPVWEELTKAVQQYLEGFTGLDQCVQRLGQIARTLALEE